MTFFASSRERVVRLLESVLVREETEELGRAV